MMQEETEALLSPEPSPKKDDGIATSLSNDLEAPSPESKGKESGDDGITIEKLRIRLLAMAQYLQQELSTMDAAKARHLSLVAKNKAIVMALALKALALQYYDELQKIDKVRAQELGLIYKGKAKSLSIEYGQKTVKVAGIARRRTVEVAGKTRMKAMEVARELKTMDREKAKAKSIDMIRRGRIAYTAMSPATRIKYGIMLFVVFYVMRSATGGKTMNHDHICYIHGKESDGKEKVADCENMLSGIPTDDITNWLFIGNKPISDLIKPILHYQNGDMKSVDKPYQQVVGDRFKRRKVMFYYKYALPDEDEWNKKYVNQEQPTEIAAEAGLGQADCTSCHMFKLHHKYKTKNVEHLLIESSRDVSQVTKTTSTSQETVARWLGENYPTPIRTACVIQQGTYEMEKAPWRTTKQYLEYTKEYHDLLEKHCGTLIRIGYLRDNGYLRKQIEEWDRGTMDLVASQSKNGYYIDVSEVRSFTEEEYIMPVFEMFSRAFKLLEVGNSSNA